MKYCKMEYLKIETVGTLTEQLMKKRENSVNFLTPNKLHIKRKNVTPEYK